MTKQERKDSIRKVLLAMNQKDPDSINNVVETLYKVIYE